MGDLEDRFFKKNIPGKYTWWEEELEDRGGDVAAGESQNDNDNDDDDSQVLHPEPFQLQARQPTTVPAVRPTTTGTGTGPKGVLAEKKRRDEMDQMERDRVYREKQAMLERWTGGATLNPSEVSWSGVAIEERKQQSKRMERRNQDEDQDDDFIVEYRIKRLEQWKKERSNVFVRYHEGLHEVDPEGYADAIDQTPATTDVVVHLYEDYIPDCQRLNRILEELSQILPARFLKLLASRAIQTMDPVGLPSLIIYRGGDLLANLTPITQELPKNFQVNHVRDLLERFGVKQSLAVPTSHNAVRPVQVQVATDADDDVYEFDQGDFANYDGID